MPSRRCSSQPVETGSNQGLLFGGRYLIAGQLFHQETIVRLVVVKRADHVIAITPGIAPVGVVLETIGLGETDNVEPVLSPTLTVARAGEQPFDQLAVSSG